MKAPPFQYQRMATLDELLSALATHGDDASILAGGQSLVPLMNLRMANPQILLDINRLTELSGIRVEGDALVVGALTRHAETLRSAEIRTHMPLIAAAMPHVAHDAVRNRGTFGGSVSLADPAAELPACCVALDAIMELRSEAGARSVPASAFFRGAYETARAENEVLVAVRIPLPRSGVQIFFDELSRRKGDYALTGLAATAAVIDGRIADPTLVYFGIEDRPVRASAAERVLANTGGADIAAAEAALDEDLDPAGDPQTSAAARLQFARVLLRRALTQWRGGVGDG
ncbi:MAG: molybdopterin dehydrogenase [Rhodospirillaceae bacterium]|nr:molybdopterin dehydrogenase [Rhodospirillaceae bacterium]